MCEFHGIPKQTLDINFILCQAVHSAFPGTELSHNLPRWDRLSNTMVNSIKVKESMHNRYWSCNLCVAHLDQIVQYSTVVEHLKSE